MAPKAAAAPKGPKYADIVKEAISHLKVGSPASKEEPPVLLAGFCGAAKAFSRGRRVCAVLGRVYCPTWLTYSHFAGEGRFQPACHQEVCGRALPQAPWTLGEDPQLPDQEDGRLWQACQGKMPPFQ